MQSDFVGHYRWPGKNDETFSWSFIIFGVFSSRKRWKCGSRSISTAKIEIAVQLHKPTTIVGFPSHLVNFVDARFLAAATLGPGNRAGDKDLWGQQRN